MQEGTLISVNNSTDFSSNTERESHHSTSMNLFSILKIDLPLAKKDGVRHIIQKTQNSTERPALTKGLIPNR